MQNIDKIDIIMPAYNCEKYVVQAINSVKEQTYKEWRLIIVNDCSLDNTKSIIEKEIQSIKDKVIFIDLSTHIGVAECRNVAINKVSNRYIAFLDLDDIWNPEKLEKQLNFMKDNEYCFTYTRYTYLKDGNFKEVKEIPSKLNYRKALTNTYILTSTVMLDTKYIDKKNILMPNIGSEDTATWWNILKSGVISYGLDENFTTYRVTNNGLSQNKFTNLKRTWKLYRKQEKLSIIYTIYNFCWYIFHATKKRIV